MKLQAGQTLLFQGDSITDCHRTRGDDHSLGQGYAMMAAARLGAAYPHLGLRCLNRGISGNRVPDLLARWQEDCLDLRPDHLSLLIGINDTWRRYDSNDPTPAAQYAAHYRELLTLTRRALPQVHLILCEPFLLPCPADRLAWREDLDPKIDVVRTLAREFKATYIPFDGLFAAATSRREPSYWAEDGVHPSLYGHALMADHWLRAIGAVP